MHSDEERDRALWKIAVRRVKFKKHLTTYLVVNGFLWLLWWLTQGRHGFSFGIAPWPIWSTVGWGIGVAFSYFGAYHSNDVIDTRKEYEKLRKDQH